MGCGSGKHAHVSSMKPGQRLTLPGILGPNKPEQGLVHRQAGSQADLDACYAALGLFTVAHSGALRYTVRHLIQGFPAPWWGAAVWYSWKPQF